MATNTVNNFVRSNIEGSFAAVSDLTISNPQVAGGYVTQIPASAALGAIIAGDLLFITSNYGIASLSLAGTSNANTTAFCGVAVETYPLIFTDQVTAPFPVGTPPKVQYKREGQFRLHTTAADTYHFGDTVYLGADGQTIQKTSSGTAIGTVASDQRSVGAQLGTAITGAAGQDIVIAIKPAI